MSDVFNLDVWVAEARREPFRFALGGTTFVLPAAGDLDKGILAAVNVDSPSAVDIVALLRAGLGDQWQEFDALPVPISAVGELFRRWQRHQGVMPGESEPSPNS
ncbi:MULTISPECIES: hypothetical protein [unclassified Kitasatospora]|uniref:hypothetical protein n=1 Tax=unclassified Kitasatospora TaxID=2633591 RepID=UPI0033D13A33